LAQLCHQELVEQMQHFLNFYATVVQPGFQKMARNVIFILYIIYCCFKQWKNFQNRLTV